MRPLAALALIAAALISAGWGSRSATAAPRIVYVTNDSHLTGAQLADALPVFETAVADDFAPVWEIAPVRLVLVTVGEAPAGAWTISVVDYPNCFFCAGYHDVDAGVPYAIVGVDPSLGDWQVTFSHELFELVGNPFVDQGVLVRGKWYARESADPVEAEALAYMRRSASGAEVRLSDFVYLAWFRPGSAGPYDFTGHVKRPLQILAEGYQLLWRGGGWTTKTR